MPKRIQSSGRNIVLSVRDFCEREKDNNAPLIPFGNVRQRVAAKTGISEKTLNKAPTLSSTKAEMQNWIINKGLSYLPTMVKAQLYKIIKEHKEAPIYEADQMLQAHCHKVARLPPYHCELNAIEFMWSLVKRRVANKNVGQETNNIVNLAEEAFQSITAEDWQKQCEHVRHIEDKLRERDVYMDAEMDRFIIELNNESDTESDSSSEDSSDSDYSSLAIHMDHAYSK
ncbi:unnamed protein product, partial [Brenthis ino]